ncbi:MAG: CPBP family intramembrane metalloprotease [Atopobiaceae bacterium]|nr:CPBP family intramembrane metalloprotease [Atopobiaceae bacterium]
MAGHMAPTAEMQPNLFFWERPGLDFPLYNDDSLGIWQPLLLIASSLVMLLSLSFLPDDRAIKTCALFFGTLVPYLIVARGNIGTIIKKPRLGDIPLVIVMLVLTIAYSIGMALLLVKLGIEMQPNAVTSETRDGMLFFVMLFQLFAEEMIKLNLFLGALILMFRWTGNRKKSIVVAIVIALFIFGIAHLRAYNGALVQILLIQGVGSIFDLFLYLRTKNILTSYAMHVIQDFMFLV